MKEALKFEEKITQKIVETEMPRYINKDIPKKYFGIFFLSLLWYSITMEAGNEMTIPVIGMVISGLLILKSAYRDQLKYIIRKGR